MEPQEVEDPELVEQPSALISAIQKLQADNPIIKYALEPLLKEATVAEAQTVALLKEQQETIRDLEIKRTLRTMLIGWKNKMIRDLENENKRCETLLDDRNNTISELKNEIDQHVRLVNVQDGTIRELREEKATLRDSQKIYIRKANETMLNFFKAQGNLVKFKKRHWEEIHKLSMMKDLENQLAASNEAKCEIEISQEDLKRRLVASEEAKDLLEADGKKWQLEKKDLAKQKDYLDQTIKLHKAQILRLEQRLRFVQDDIEDLKMCNEKVIQKKTEEVRDLKRQLASSKEATNSHDSQIVALMNKQHKLHDQKNEAERQKTAAERELQSHKNALEYTTKVLAASAKASADVSKYLSSGKDLPNLPRGSIAKGAGTTPAACQALRGKKRRRSTEESDSEESECVEAHPNRAQAIKDEDQYSMIHDEVTDDEDEESHEEMSRRRAWEENGETMDMPLGYYYRRAHHRSAADVKGVRCQIFNRASKR
jgi:hypothetical protein